MKGNMRKDYLYRYLFYRFEKETFKNSALEGTDQEAKERICQQATKTTRRISVFVGLLASILLDNYLAECELLPKSILPMVSRLHRITISIVQWRLGK